MRGLRLPRRRNQESKTAVVKMYRALTRSYNEGGPAEVEKALMHLPKETAQRLSELLNRAQRMGVLSKSSSSVNGISAELNAFQLSQSRKQEANSIEEAVRLCQLLLDGNHDAAQQLMADRARRKPKTK